MLTGDVTATASLASNGLDTPGVGTFKKYFADKIIHTGDTDTAIRFPAADTFTVRLLEVKHFKMLILLIL